MCRENSAGTTGGVPDARLCFATVQTLEAQSRDCSREMYARANEKSGGWSSKFDMLCANSIKSTEEGAKRDMPYSTHVELYVGAYLRPGLTLIIHIKNVRQCHNGQPTATARLPEHWTTALFWFF